MRARKLRYPAPLTDTSLYILLSLLRGSKHGYAISQDISRLSAGEFHVPPGNVYVSLRRLQSARMVELIDATVASRPSKVYRLSAYGKKVVAHERARIERLSAAFSGGESVRNRAATGLPVPSYVPTPPAAESSASTEGTEGQRVAQRAYWDTVTSLPNGAAFESLCEQAVHAQSSFGLVLIALEDLDDYVREFHRDKIDRLLYEVGRRLSSAVLPGDTIARVGGSTFAILHPKIDERSVLTFSQQIVDALALPFTLNDESVQVDVRIGVAIYPGHGSDATTLLSHASFALDAARRARTGWKVYTLDDEERGRHTSRLSLDLKKALAQGGLGLELHYQPEVPLRPGSCTVVEALARWHHPSLGELVPSEFIPMAEERGLIGKFTTWSIREAVRACASLQAKGIAVSVAVNVSAKALGEPNAVAEILSTLQTAGVPPSALVLELSEAAMLVATSASLALKQLASAGVQFSLDDFGTGYTSLASLQTLNVSELKIDQSFVAAMPQDPRADAVVRAIIKLAHEIGLRVVAEGVEDDAKRVALAMRGCDFAQGFGIAAPMRLDDLNAWFQTAAADQPWGVESNLPATNPAISA